jgi:penicillin-binding protein
VEKYIKKLIFIVCLVIVIVISSFYIIHKGENNIDVLSEYYTLINKQSYNDLYDLISKESKNKYSLDQFIKINQDAYETIEAKNININNIVKKDNNQLSYDVTMETIAGTLKFSNTTTFKNNKIVWSTHFIYPYLLDNYKMCVSTLYAKRGKIVDRNNKVLAQDSLAYKIGLVKNECKDYSQISKLLNITSDSIEKKMSASWVKDDSLVIIKTIRDETIKNQLSNIEGVHIQTTLLRNYPYNEVTSHLIGYVQKANEDDLKQSSEYTSNSYIGRSGIELAYEDELRGHNGVEIYIENEANSRISNVLKENYQNGKDIQLTIDIDLQKDLYNQFKNDKSATVALNPKNGEVLALVSTPSYSANDFVLGLSDELWNSYNKNQDKPLFNRFLSTYVPGSSMKPITALIGLENKVINTKTDLKAAKKWQNNASWGNYYVTTLHAPKPNNLKNALIYSDNVYFAKTAIKIGKDKLEKSYQQLKIGEEIPFELTVTSSKYKTKDFSDEILIADSGYGQGEMLINPIQMACMYSLFVNEGNIMTPHVLMETKQNQWISSSFSKETIEEVKNDLIAVIDDKDGTGHAIKNEKHVLAGKTGTGEVKNSQQETGTTMGWFNVMDVDNSSIVMSSVVEDKSSSYVVKKLKTPLNHFLDK